MQFSLVNYKTNLVDVKILDRGNKWENILHMTLGHTSEISEELMGAVNSKNTAQIAAEIGDAQFFLVGTMKFLDLWQEKYYQKFNNSDTYLLDLGFSWTETSREEVNISEHITNLIFNIQICNGKINTVIKNLLIKDTPKLDGKILTEEEIVDLFLRQQVNLNTLSYIFGFHIFEIRKINFEKLNVRYENGFTTEESLNRDTEKEDQKIIETIQK